MLQLVSVLFLSWESQHMVIITALTETDCPFRIVSEEVPFDQSDLIMLGAPLADHPSDYYHAGAHVQRVLCVSVRKTYR
jgi:hypothetical protein